MLHIWFAKKYLSFVFYMAAIIYSSLLVAEPSKVDAAVNIVENLCLSGTEYGITADVNGNITIKSFKPKGSGSLTLNARESKGATALQENLRIIGDQDVRECTQKHIGRILDAVFESTPPSSENIKKEYVSISKAKFLGYVPEEVEVQDFVEGEIQLYFRFSVKQPATVKIEFEKNSQRLDMNLVTTKEKSIVSGYFRSGQGTEEHFLMPGDYYVIVKCYNKKEATAFKMKIKAVV